MSTKQFMSIVVLIVVGFFITGALGWFVFNRSEIQKVTIQETGKEVIGDVNDSTDKRAEKTDKLLKDSFSDLKTALEEKTDAVKDILFAHDKSTAAALAKLNKDHEKLILIQNELLEQRKQHDRISATLSILDMKSDQSLKLLAESQQKLEDSRLRIDELAAQIASIKSQQAVLASDITATLVGLAELRGKIGELINKTDSLLVVHGIQDSDIRGILAALGDLNEKLAKIDGMVETLGRLQQTTVNIQNTIMLTEQHITNLTQNITNITYNIEKMHSIVITNIKLLCKSIGDSDKPRPSECPPSG